MMILQLLLATTLVQDTPTERGAAHDVIRKMGELKSPSMCRRWREAVGS